jgi:GDPmannose 4,6-dehydratase
MIGEQKNVQGISNNYQTIETGLKGSSKPKVAFISGITGQDGSYLAEFLLKMGYEIHGMIRRSSSFNTARIDHIYEDPHNAKKMWLHYGDMLSQADLRRIIDVCNPNEVYNLAAQSHVKVSFDQPEYSASVAFNGTLNILEAIRWYQEVNGDLVKFYQASSSEMFGSAPPPQSENTQFRPRSPYAVGKAAAYWSTVNYRDGYDIFACNGILFNHESPRRGENFVTRKITRGMTRIKLGLQKKLFLGNLKATRDWGFAGDYVKAMWAMLQRDKPDDYVIATGKSYSVQEFLEAVSMKVGLNWQDHVEIDQRYLRPTEVDNLCGDTSKAKIVLGWEPQTNFNDLVNMMVEEDMKLAEKERRAG